MKENILKTDRYQLNPESIDRISDRIEEFLTGSGETHREVARKRLTTECCLEIWSAGLGAETECTLKTGARFGRKYVTLEVPGKMLDPSGKDTEVPEDGRGKKLFIDNTGLLAAVGYIPEYHYVNGSNVLKIWAPAARPGKKGLRTALALLAGALILLISYLFPRAGSLIYDYAVSPVYSIFMRLLSTICGPLVLFSIMSGICGMGDVASFGKTGLVAVKRFLGMSFILLVIASAFSLCFFPLSLDKAEAGSGLQNLIRMIVEIVPSDPVSPFATGNALQIVFIGIILGFTVLYLSNSVSDLSNIISQMNHVVLQAMRFLGMLMPVFMEVAILKLLMSSTFSQILGILKPVLIIWGGLLVLIAAETLIVSLKTKTSFFRILKVTVPASVIALSTASSTAALDKMNENCTEGLGVDETVSGFAIPLGQVIFKAPAAFTFFMIALFSADYAGIAITPAFFVINLLVSWVLGISMAPVSGAMASCLSILYLQLGIPQDLITLGISVSLLIDNIGSMTSVQLLQEEVFAIQASIRKRQHPQA